MLSKELHVELPRRLTAYYLLFCAAVFVCLAIGAIEITQRVLTVRSESSCLTRIGRASSTFSLALLRHGPSAAQDEIEKLQQTGAFAYIALVGPEGKYVAHSDQQHVGKRLQETDGERVYLGEVQRLDFTDDHSRHITEYRVPVRFERDAPGTLHLAVQQPHRWSAVMTAARHAPLTALCTLSLFCVGGLVVYRTVQPLGEVERQLRQLAEAPPHEELRLQPVSARSAAALGWNYLTKTVNAGPSCQNLEQRLNEAVQGMGKQKSDDVLNSLADGVMVTDAEGRIEFANRAVAALLDNTLGGDDLSLRGHQVDTCLAFASDQPPLEDLLDPELIERTTVAELSRPTGNGNQVLRVARQPLQRRERRARRGHVWSVRDITQLRLASQARDEFLDAATHELRTPLANIKAYAETLSLSEMTDLDQQKEFCNTINSEATRLARLIDDLLSVSSMEVGALSLNRQETNIERLLRECAAKVSQQMDNKQIIFEIVLAEKLPQLEIDKDKLAAALVNLLGNAAKYTPVGGRVTLRVRVDEEHLRIDVQDTGVGIVSEEIPLVFDKFFRSGDARVRDETGTGLGLAFAQEVVRLHDGVLSVESVLDEGSTFTIELPMH